MADIPIDQTKQMVNSALYGPVPKSYVNGFNVGLSATDLFVVTTLMGTPINVIFMNLSTAKTMMLALKDLVESVEKEMGSILTMDEMSKITQGPNLEGDICSKT